MYLLFKFVKYSLLTNYRIEFNPTFCNTRSILSLRKMPNAKVKKMSTGLGAPVEIQVVGSGAVGVPGSVVIINGNSRYLINCGEGSQKLGNEYKLGLQKISHVFITSPNWKNISGLLGLILSHQKSGYEEFVLHGHNCIENIFHGTNKFVSLKYNRPKIKKFHHYEEFSNDSISVKYVFLYPSSAGICDRSASKSSLITPDQGQSSSIKEDFVPNAEKDFHLSSEKKSPYSSEKYENKKIGFGRDSSEKILKLKRNNKSVISYILQTPSTSGSLHFEKCVELGVPPGPLLGQLKKGEDVTLENGKLIRSVEVKDPDVPGVNIIVVECPTEAYLDSLLKEPIYSKYQSGENIAAAVVHLSSSQVVKNPKYKEWINHFHSETKHLFINEDNKLSGSVSIHRQQFKLNYLQPNIFPLLHDAGIPDFPRAENGSVEKGHILIPSSNHDVEPIYSDKVFYKCESNSFINGETLCTLHLKPKLDYDYMECLTLKKDEFLNEMFKSDSEVFINKYKEKLKDLELTLESDKRIYPKIVFLGTGSGKPSKVRNASGILIFLEEDKCMIFDCGESTYNQLINFYGKDKVEEILRKLVAIYVSHHHVDHHMGLITLLKERKLAFDKLNELLMKESKVQVQEHTIQPEFQPAFLLAPLQIRRWLDLYSEKFEEIFTLYDLIPNSVLVENNNELMEKKKDCKKSLNLTSVMTTPVWHCQGSFGVSIAHKNGWKITYSGDTRPCDALVKLGMGSDILIHEATFEDAYAYEAEAKAHSTTSQAIEVGRRMNAKYILLTHFSQRYPYLPVIEDDFKNLNIGIAFDFMEVSFNKLPLLPELLEPLQYIFSEYDTKEKTLQKFFSLKRNRNEANIASEECSFENAERYSKIMKKI